MKAVRLQAYGDVDQFRIEDGRSRRRRVTRAEPLLRRRRPARAAQAAPRQRVGRLPS